MALLELCPIHGLAPFVTGLALTLACGGGDDDDTSVIIAGPSNVRVNLPGSGVTGHQYLVTASADGTVSKYEASSTLAGTTTSGGTFTAISSGSGNNVWRYTPASTGVHLVTVKASNNDNASASGTNAFEITAQTTPALPLTKINEGGAQYQVNVYAGNTTPVVLPDRETIDGDNVTWGGTFTGDFVDGGASSKGTVAIEGGSLKVFARSTTPDGVYTFTGLRATETGPNIPDNAPINTTYTIRVQVGAGGGGGYEDRGPGIIQTNLEGQLEAIRGVPHNLFFAGRTITGANYPGTTWEVNNGITDIDATNMGAGGFDIAWISNPGDQVPPEKFAAGDFTPREVGTLIFRANPSATTFSANSSNFRQYLGVRATFPSGDTAYVNFMLTVRDNTPPLLYADTQALGAKQFTVFDAPWNNRTYPTAYALTPLKFKSSAPGSKAIEHQVTLTGLKVVDIDGKYDDNLKITLYDIRSDNPAITGNLNGQLGQYFKLSADGGNTHTRSLTDVNEFLTGTKLTFTPPTDDTKAGTTTNIIAGSTLTLYFKVTDWADAAATGGSLTQNGTTYTAPGGTYAPGDATTAMHAFTIIVPTAINEPPVIDNFDPDIQGWKASSADRPISAPLNGWVSAQPIIDFPVEWKIKYDDNTPARYKVVDPDGTSLPNNAPRAAVMMYIDSEHTGMNLLQDKKLVAKDGEFNIAWTPPAALARKHYEYTLGAYNEYGAKATEVTIDGIVWGPVWGKPVAKKLYGYASTWSNNGMPAPTGPVQTATADFTRWTSVDFNPFFDVSNRTYGNRYGRELYQMGWTFDFDVDTTNPAAWKIRGVPDGHYLVSGGTVSQMGVTSGPVIGPAVTAESVGYGSGSFATTGDHPWTQGTGAKGVGQDAFTYAFISSDNPDLTTHVPFGIMAGLIDTSITYDVLGSSNAINAGDTITERLGGSNVPAYFGNLNLYFADRPDFEPKLAGQNSTYEGRLGYIEPGMLTDGGAIQFVFRDTNQKAFFRPSDALLAGDYPVDGPSSVPAGAYPAGLSWNNVQGVAASVVETGDAGHSYFPIELKLGNGTTAGAGALAYAVKVDDKLNILGMAKTQLSTLDISPSTLTGSYWKAITTATSDTPAIGDAAVNGGVTGPVNIQFDPVEDGPAFSAKVTRSSFLTAAGIAATGSTVTRGSVARTAVAATNLSDTLQIVNYGNGTALGPVENPNAVATLLEFGNLTNISGTGISTFAAAADPTFNAPVPKPVTSRWNGAFNPVVSYKVNYLPGTGGAFTSFVPGSMGVLATDLTKAVVAQAPITRLRITTVGRYDELTASNNIQASTNLTYGPNYLETAMVTPVTTGIPAQAYDDKDNGYRAVWLTWKNPTTSTGEPIKFSGNIIEFFDAGTINTTGTDATKTTAGLEAVPLYRVHVAPDVEAFPIPQNWIESGNLNDHDITDPAPLANVVIRVRTITYGSEADGTLVDFNETPFIQAFPATWIDTISARVNLSGVIFPADPEMLWKKREMIRATNAPTATFPALMATTITPAPAVGWALNDSKLESANFTSNEEGATLTYTWKLKSVTSITGPSATLTAADLKEGGDGALAFNTAATATANVVALPTLTLTNTAPYLDKWNNVTSVALVMEMTAKDNKADIENTLDVPVTISMPGLTQTQFDTSPSSDGTGSVAFTVGTSENLDLTLTINGGGTAVTAWAGDTGELTNTYAGAGVGTLNTLWSIPSGGITYNNGTDWVPVAGGSVTVTGTLTALDYPTLKIDQSGATTWAADNNPIRVTLRFAVRSGTTTTLAYKDFTITVTPSANWF